jgi:ZIP family zinc transporter
MRQILRIAGPFLMIVLVAIGFVQLDPLAVLRGNAPPVEKLTIELAQINQGELKLRLRAESSEAMSVAQVQVDGAYWKFEQTPPGPLSRLRTAWITMNYPWVQGESHHITVLTNTGATFDYAIDVAMSTPDPASSLGWFLGLIGLFVGMVPVTLGMLFFPALRAAGPGIMAFVLALTMGLLAYLFVDTLSEAQDLAEKSAETLSIRKVVWLVALVTAVGLFMIGRRLGAGSGNGRGPAMLACAIALGIGLHNFGEGLAIGGAFASGAVTLGSFLVIGFTLHNITEGIGIVAPLTDQRPDLLMLCGLSALAGLPAVLGLWVGVQAFSTHWAAIALAVGAGAILQVLIEVGLLIQRRYLDSAAPQPLSSLLAGGVLGLVLMYSTSLIVTV